MAEKNPRRNETIDALFDAILSLETREECYDFFEDLCTGRQHLRADRKNGGDQHCHHQPHQPLHPVRHRRLPADH